MIQLNEIAFSIEAELIHANKEILNVRQIDDTLFDNQSIAWCSDKNIEILKNISCGSVIISSKTYQNFQNHLNTEVSFLVVENPRKSFAKMLNAFFVSKINFGKIGNNTFIDESVIFDSNSISLGNNVVVEKDCMIGKNVIIDHNTVVKSGTIICDHVKIGSNCTIGGVGFGYEPNEDGLYEVIPHIGNVILKEHVEIGNNVCIDRAVLGSTILDEHVKVDNLVHIAHGVQIGKNSLVIANAMLAGSVKIGENCWIAPSSSIIQKVSIGDNVLIGMGSVVLKNVEDNAKMAGVPAKKLN